MKRLFILLLLSLPMGVLAQSEVYFRQPVADRNLNGLTAGEITLVQTGQVNQITYRETGIGNQVSLSQQGAANTLDIDISGSNNRHSFAQQGDNNATLWRTQQSNSQLEVLQRGNNNMLVQDGSNPVSGLPMRIEQTGGMQLIIRN